MNKSFRDFAVSLIINNKILVISVFGLFMRSYKFYPSYIILNDRVLSFLSSLQLYHIPLIEQPILSNNKCEISTNKIIINSKYPLTKLTESFSPKGILNVYRTNKKKNTIIISLL